MTVKEARRIIELTIASSLQHNVGTVTVTKEDLEVSLQIIAKGLLGPEYELANLNLDGDVATFDLVKTS